MRSSRRSDGRLPRDRWKKGRLFLKRRAPISLLVGRHTGDILPRIIGAIRSWSGSSGVSGHVVLWRREWTRWLPIRIGKLHLLLVHSCSPSLNNASLSITHLRTNGKVSSMNLIIPDCPTFKLAYIHIILFIYVYECFRRICILYIGGVYSLK